MDSSKNPTLRVLESLEKVHSSVFFQSRTRIGNIQGGLIQVLGRTAIIGNGQVAREYRLDSV